MFHEIVHEPFALPEDDIPDRSGRPKLASTSLPMGTCRLNASRYSNHVSFAGSRTVSEGMFSGWCASFCERPPGHFE
jgi:hypothetical protein